MILDCPACRARFLVADGLIPTAGRIVRCGKCTHEWFVERAATSAAAPAVAAVEPFSPAPGVDTMPAAAAEAAPETIAPARFRHTLPVIRKPKINPKPFKIAAPAIAALWLIAAFIAYFPGWSNGALGGLYSAFGVTPTDGLVFADVHMEREQEGNKTRFVLSGSIRNHSSGERIVPTVRVELKDKQNKAFWGRDYKVNTALKAGDIYPFRISNVETTFAKNVTSIVVDLGNSFELMVR